ncbi:MAG: sigma-54-dependent Fis family transcriptional regulator, partial [Bdellovibrionales bacterium]|nr:sigma-54-dependent Fis family transcriptional regulator [Bdellovibrionales bacterium]
PIFLPPLRERVEDIENLTHYFIQKFSEKYQKPVPTVTDEVLALFKTYNWPGNIRELENTIERGLVMYSPTVIKKEHLPDSIQNLQPSAGSFSSGNELNFEKFKEEAEKEFIINALKANNGRINQTVANANIPKNTLLRKIKKFNIVPKDYSKK